MEWFVVLALVLLAHLVGFVAMARDKQAARRKRWRTPEATLLGLSVATGGVGMWMAAHLLRHKTRKTGFLLGLYFLGCVGLILQIWVAGLLLGFGFF